MKKCYKCGKTIYNTDISYCPDCGKLLSGEKERILITESEYQSFQQAPGDLVLYDKKKYEDAVNFLRSHLSTGYAPSGKVIVDQAEYDRLWKTKEEFVQNKTKFGTQFTRVFVNGEARFYFIPKYGVTQRTVSRTVNAGFGDFWKIIYDKQDLWVRIVIQVVFWLLIA